MDKNNELNSIGVCPVCGKGHIIERQKKYVCDNPSCGFFLHKEIKRKTITPDMARKIIAEGQSDVMQFSNVNGEPFRAKIKIDGKGIKIFFENKYLDGKCPICGGRIQITERGYNCENRVKRGGDKKCSFHANKWLCNRQITKEEMENFLSGKIELLDGFMSSSGNVYSGFLELSEEGYVRTNSKISVCPKCGGTILVGQKAFNCENFKSEGCKMKIPKQVAGYNLTIQDVRQLCERDNHTSDEIVVIKQANGDVIKRKLTFDENWNTITI